MALYRTFLFLMGYLLSSLYFTVPVHAEIWDAFRILRTGTPNMCALTFDDGPHPRTKLILDALHEENIKATFFVLGMQVAQYPAIAQRIHAEGHEIGNHSQAHLDLRTLSKKEIFKDLKGVQDALQTLGITSRYLRPPYGNYDEKVIQVAHELDLNITLWSTDSRDWEAKRPDYSNMPNVLNRPLRYEEMRGIFLFHDTKLRTAKDIRLIFMALRAVGCEKFVTLSEFLHDAARVPYITPQRKKRSTPKPSPKTVFNADKYAHLPKASLEPLMHMKNIPQSLNTRRLPQNILPPPAELKKKHEEKFIIKKDFTQLKPL